MEISDLDALDVWLDVRHGRVVAFSANYRALIQGGWTEVLRYDTAHGRLHVHEFWPNGRERVRMLGPPDVDDYTVQAAQAMRDLYENWPRYRAVREES